MYMDIWRLYACRSIRALIPPFVLTCTSDLNSGQYIKRYINLTALEQLNVWFVLLYCFGVFCSVGFFCTFCIGALQCWGWDGGRDEGRDEERNRDWDGTKDGGGPPPLQGPFPVLGLFEDTMNWATRSWGGPTEGGNRRPVRIIKQHCGSWETPRRGERAEGGENPGLEE